MKSLVESIHESLLVENSVVIGAENLVKYSKYLDKKSIGDAKNSFDSNWIKKSGSVKIPNKLWEDLFTILAGELKSSLSYEENMDIVKKYFADESIFDKGLEGYQLHNSKALYENGDFFVQFGPTSQRAYITLRNLQA